MLIPNVKGRFNYTTICLMSVLIGSFILAYYPVWKGLLLAWCTSDQYSHGFLIPPLCGYILWRKKELLSRTPISPCRLAFGIIVFSLLLYIFAHHAEIVTLAYFSMVLLIAGITLYLYGSQLLREVLFPLFFLLFMIPVPAQIYASLTIPLQLFVSEVSVGISSLLGLPIYREGNVIHLPDQTLEVMQACSGLRSMISLLTLSAIFGYFTLRSNLLRAALLVCGVPAAILVNIIRVLLLVLAFHYFNLDLTNGTVHTILGIVVFVLALVFIVATKGVLSNWDVCDIAR